MDFEVVAIVISVFSLIVSIVSAIFARKSSARANAIASDNLQLQHGLVELELSQSIEGAKAKINDLGVVMAPFVAKRKKGTISEEEQETLNIYDKNLNASIQSLLNTYDAACSKYIDGKIDKVRFKKNYQVEIRNLLENDDLKEYFDPITSRYKPILVVYNEWENSESNA